MLVSHGLWSMKSDTDCTSLLHERQQTITMRNNVLLKNTARSHLHSYLVSGMSRGLTTRVTLTRVSRRRLGSLLDGGRPASDFISVP
jgi:hypothetical protein